MSENRLDKRTHARHPIALDVVLVEKGERYPAVTRDLSIGGMFICTTARFQFGGDIVVRVDLPALKQSADIEATVRWQTTEGIGVSFHNLRARQVWALNHLFKERGLLK